MATRIDLGMALLELESWRKLYLTSDLRIVCGDVEGDSFLDRLAARDGERFRRQLSGAGVDQPVSGIYFDRDDAPLEILVTDRGAGYDLFLRPIANRLRSLEELSTFYRHFLTTPTAICITSAHGEIRDANRAFLDFYGYAIHEVVGRNPRILKSGRQSPAAYRELWQQITDPALGHWSGELINRKRSGEEVTVHLTVSSVRRSNGELTGFVATTLDITRSKLLEAQLSSMNQELEDLNRLKNEVMAVTSHDLKSPLNGIISRVRLMQEELDELPPAKIREHLEQIVVAGSRLTGFINELLDMEKIEAGRYQLHTERLRVDALVRLCVEINAPSAAVRGMRLTFAVEGKPYPVAADGAKLEQVFNNLISNAIKYAPEGSEIEVVYREVSCGREIAVLDRGPGLPEEDLGEIFDRYYQVKKKGYVPKRVFGVGLGLAIVKQIVELHGGTVGAANRPGGGSVFTVSLPDPPPRTAAGLAALVIDPRDTIFRYVGGPLQLRGVAHFFARTAFEAERVLENERPNLIFIDASADSTDFARLLEVYQAAGEEGALVVGIGPETSRSKSFRHWFSEPVLDIEILEFLDETRLNSRG